MKYAGAGIALATIVIPLRLGAVSLPDSDAFGPTTVTLFEQVSFVNKQGSEWQINGKNPYTRNKVFNDAGVNVEGHCALVTDTLDLDYSLFGLTWYSTRLLAEFERDPHRSRAVIERLRLAYTVSERVQLDVGKLKTKPGLFYLRSPFDLVSQYYGGFKPTRLYDPQLKNAYFSSSWAGTLSVENDRYALFLTAIPELAKIDKRYLSSSEWTETQRGNSSEAWLLEYNPRHFRDHTPGIRVLLGDAQSVAVSDSYRYMPQMAFNVELAYHQQQRWRHLSGHNERRLEHYQFPSALYAVQDKPGFEFAAGGQYTTDDFSIFGVEYYFQSEGYSRAQWQEQRRLLRFLNTRSGFEPLDKAFDSYKYLMSSEIGNIGNKGLLQGKHYLNVWSSIQMDGGAKVQPYLVSNLTDYSAIAGLHVSTPVRAINDRLEVYSGFYTAVGRKSAEFSLFGEALGGFVGFKYYL